MIELRSLGTATLAGGNGADVRAVVTQAKRLGLLFYLAVARPRGFQRRDTLLALFWPELDRASARRSLRQALHALRATLGTQAVVTRGSEEVALAESEVWCDAVALEAAVTQDRLAEAAELYKGDFLCGFYVREAAEFEHWCERERSRLRRLAFEAGTSLARLALHNRKAREAIRWVRWVADIEPWDEDALREVVFVLCSAGDRSEALRVYDEFAARLLRERGVRPCAETRRYIETVKISGELDPVPGAG